MTNTTQDLNSIRESNAKLFALKLNIEGILSTEKRLLSKKMLGAGPYRSRPIRSAVVGLARRTPPVLGVIITARRLIVDSQLFFFFGRLLLFWFSDARAAEQQDLGVF